MSDKKDKDIKNFIINYEDGTSKTVEKGFSVRCGKMRTAAAISSSTWSMCRGRNLREL